MSTPQNKIFIGGFGGVGSRLLSEIFKKFELYTAEEVSNVARDFGGMKFANIFNKCFKNNNYIPLFNYINENLENKDNFAIKHGHLMYCFDELKEYFSGCTNIYIMRNPVDAALKHFSPHVIYGGLPNTMEKKVQYYIDESIIACGKADLVVKFEDLCINIDSELSRIRKFFKFPTSISPKIEIIIPSSIGDGKGWYDKFDMSKLGY